MNADVVKLREGQPDDQPPMTDTELVIFWRGFGAGWNDCAKADNKATFDAGYLAGIELMLDVQAAAANPSPSRRRRSRSTADLSVIAS